MSPALPSGAELLTSLPAEYGSWWSIVESCSDLRGSLADVEWWVVPDRRTLEDGDDVAGRYSWRDHRIVLAGTWTHDGYLVRHEMLHALLGVRGLEGHPKTFFEQRCGGIVSCSGACLSDVGRPDADVAVTPRIEPGSTEVTVQLVPPVLRREGSAWRCTTIVVGAENIGLEPAVMDLRGPNVFSWTLEGWGGGSGGGPIPPNDLVLLMPGDVRHYAFDCPEVFSELASGEYLVRGRWDVVESADAKLSVLP